MVNLISIVYMPVSAQVSCYCGNIMQIELKELKKYHKKHINCTSCNEKIILCGFQQVSALEINQLQKALESEE